MFSYKLFLLFTLHAGSADEMTANEQRDAEKYRKNTCKRPSTAPSSGELTFSIESSHVVEENRPATSPVTSPANFGRSFDFTQHGSTLLKLHWGTACTFRT